jgi:hypothetical protein
VLSPPNCVQLSGDVVVRDGRTFVLFQGHLTVFGGPGCAHSREHVRGSVLSNPIFFGETIASADGSYSISGTLSPEIGVGDHQLIIDFGPGRTQLARPITVVASLTGAGGGKLPRTGSNVAALVEWAVLLMGVGMWLIATSRTWLVPVIRRWRPSPVFAPPDAPPFIDTSAFTPLRPEEPAVRQDDEDDWPFFTPLDG